MAIPLTQQEIKYIAKKWLPHKSLYSYVLLWGESFTKANPETYLAMKRGGIFKKIRGFNNYKYFLILEKYLEYTKDDSFLYYFVSETMESWINFLQISNKEYHNMRQYKKENLVHLIEEKLLDNINTYERLYTI